MAGFGGSPGLSILFGIARGIKNKQITDLENRRADLIDQERATRIRANEHNMAYRNWSVNRIQQIDAAEAEAVERARAQRAEAVSSLAATLSDRHEDPVVRETLAKQFLDQGRNARMFGIRSEQEERDDAERQRYQTLFEDPRLNAIDDAILSENETDGRAVLDEMVREYGPERIEQAVGVRELLRQQARQRGETGLTLDQRRSAQGHGEALADSMVLDLMNRGSNEVAKAAAAAGGEMPQQMDERNAIMAAQVELRENLNRPGLTPMEEQVLIEAYQRTIQELDRVRRAGPALQSYR